MMVWIAKVEYGMSREEINSGLMVCSIKELGELDNLIFNSSGEVE